MLFRSSAEAAVGVSILRDAAVATGAGATADDCDRMLVATTMPRATTPTAAPMAMAILVGVQGLALGTGAFRAAGNSLAGDDATGGVRD